MNNQPLKEKELKLWKEYKNGNTLAGQNLIDSLMPIINQQVSKYAGVSIPKSAIEMEAKRLTYEAFDTYDPTRSQLNTHIFNYLKKLQRYVINYQNVGHIPEPRARQIGKYTTIYENLETEKGREPTVLELADYMSWAPAEVERLQKEIRNDLSIGYESGSDEDMSSFFEQMSNPLAVENFQVKQAINFVYYDVDPIDKKILEYTFGLGGVLRIKDKEIINKLNISNQQLSKRKAELAKQIKTLVG